MRFVQPDYMSLFHCIADKCRHSCCIGWEIAVDDSSLARYQAIPGPWGERLRQGIDAEASCFRLGPGRRCAFLREDGLCEIICHDGEDALCDVCAEHPRFYNRIAGCEECGLGLCCEEAARVILSRNAPTRLIAVGDPDPADPEENKILALRQELTALFQNRAEAIGWRVINLHRRAAVELESTDPILFIDVLQGFERLDPAWDAWLALLFEAPRSVELPPQLVVPMEQLMVYLLYRHLPQAAADGDVKGHVALALILWRIIHRMILASPTPTLESLLEAVRLMSAEIEYSDVNADALRNNWLYPPVDPSRRPLS